MPKEKNKNLIPRPPIVVVMGHIDHGKTTLLDHIRKSKVTEGEAGGITQHVSAYEIEVKPSSAKATEGQRKITFLDTPGHEAFSKIRSRGTKIADIAILVIAADDGVNTQTIEALEVIKETDTPFIVAINKIDKENTSSDKIKKELSEKEVFLEGWGGETPSVDISAKTGKGVDELLEMTILMAGLEDLKNDDTADASGYVIESHIDKKRGIAATLIIQSGTLKQGMYVATEKSNSPVRIFEDFAGKPIKEASASSPVTIIGFNELPRAGAEFKSYKNKKEVPLFVKNEIETKTESSTSTSDLPAGKASVDITTIIPIIIKSDVIGSAEALESSFVKASKDKEVELNILRADVGDINEDDVKLAGGAQGSIIIGFHVNCPQNIKILAERMGVEVKLFNIIYEAEDWLKEEIEKRRPVETIEETIGKAKIIKIFKDDKTKKIVGAEITEGKISKNSYVKIFRRDFMLGEGKILELRQQQAKVEEVKEGEQFGALIQTKANIAPHDKLEIINKGVVAK